jgi:predicted RNA-binding protein with PIN domain
MKMIIDGHNLIPHIPGLSLAELDDEIKLVNILQDYGRLRRKSIEVYFDQAPVGQAGERQFGLVKAIFVLRGTTADQAIMDRLKKLGKRAKNVAVVSSDRQVQSAARTAHAKIITSADFAADWQKLLSQKPEIDPRSRPLSDTEVAMWEKLFSEGYPPSDKRS